MVDDRQRFGQTSEQMVAQYLQREGYRILETNYRTRAGEIDIIADHNGTIVFIEVKARRSRSYGDPKWAITPAKQRKLSMLALVYLKAHKAMYRRARFDVVTVQMVAAKPIIEVIRNAFELAYG
ncbi:YraN family protein [Desulfatitalea tepidiphila]|uniref:YraN family protein n=1 Tax=Desulfatitalea tepidiphila TaxID=1185843 RepID=UPI0006B512B7|nr:YraN family protein [Desulfatitalea tepidiphila]